MIYHFTKYESLFGILKPCQIVFEANHYSAWEEDYGKTRQYVEPIVKEICISTNNHYDETMELDPYVISFTNLLYQDNMWEIFGDDYTGIALAFDEKIIESISYRMTNPDIFMKCHYQKKNEDLRQWMLACRENDFPAYTINNLEDDLRTISVFILPEKFYEESEFRYVIPVHRDFNCWLENDIPQFQDAVIGAKKELELPMSALKAIYFGRNVSATDVCNAKKYVKHCGFELPDDKFIQLP